MGEIFARYSFDKGLISKMQTAEEIKCQRTNYQTNKLVNELNWQFSEKVHKEIFNILIHKGITSQSALTVHHTQSKWQSPRKQMTTNASDGARTKEPSYKLLLGIQTSALTVEITVEIHQKATSRHNSWLIYHSWAYIGKS
jgi:hypothetical protein